MVITMNEVLDSSYDTVTKVINYTKYTEAKWIERCATHLMKLRNMEPEVAYSYAKACYYNDDPADGLTPEQAAGNEMEGWGG